MTAYAVRGLDINTSYTIYNLMTEQKMKGVAVIFVGEDLDVLLELCDRILVLCGGKVSGIVDARTATKEEIGLMMTQRRRGRRKRQCINENKVPLIRLAKRGHDGALEGLVHPRAPPSSSRCLLGGLVMMHRPARRRERRSPPTARSSTGALGKKTAIRQTVKLAVPLLGMRAGHRPVLQDALLEHRRRGPDHRGRHAPRPTSPCTASASCPVRWSCSSSWVVAGRCSPAASGR